MGESIAKAGFYDGKFYKAGQSAPDKPQSDSAVGDSKPLADMTKDELLAEAESRGVDVKASDTKAEIVDAIEAAERPAS